jgi:hypothetical protein
MHQNALLRNFRVGGLNCIRTTSFDHNWSTSAFNITFRVAELSFCALLPGKAGGAAWAGMGVLAASISIAVHTKHTLAFNPLNSEVALGTAQKNYQTTFKDKIVTNDGSVSSIIIKGLIASDGLLNLS